MGVPQGRRGRGAGGHGPLFSKSSDFRKSNVSSENFRTFAVGKDREDETFFSEKEICLVVKYSEI